MFQERFLSSLFLTLLFTEAAWSLPATQCEGRPNKPAPTVKEKEVSAKLAPLKQCTTQVDDRTACNVFLGRALNVLFGNKDFQTGGGGYMLANDIANGLELPGNAGWRKIGTADDQKALDTAQALANSSRPVVAARLGALKPDGTRGAGHVALIIPGTTQKYGFDGFAWGDLIAPNAASFFLDQPDRFFIGCPLSAVWRKPDQVGLYYKP